jgi:hypothetical protein
MWYVSRAMARSSSVGTIRTLVREDGADAYTIWPIARRA